MALVTVLCANAGTDKTFEVPGFKVGGFHHPKRVQTAPGGKGINVARVLRALGQDVTVTGFAGGSSGRQIQRGLRREGVLTGFVEIAEESRLCINIVDTKGKTQTRLDEVGPLVTPSEVNLLKLRWNQLMAESQLLIISGSAPRGVPYDLYGQLILAARKRRVPTILDAHDEMLRDGVQAGPTVIKPNLAELSVLFEKELSVPNGVVEAARSLFPLGVQVVVCSLGADGAVVVTRDHGDWRVRAPKVDLISPVGCGDAMVAGLACATMERKSLQERLVWAAAAGSACANTFAAGFAERSTVEELVPLVQCDPLVDAGDPFEEVTAEEQ